MSKHTPGPWCLRVSDNGTPHIEHGDCLRYEVGDLLNRVCVMPAEISMNFNSLNNARLMAAAPELLEAGMSIKKAMEYGSGFDSHADFWTAITMLDAAIAKATGAE